MARQLVREATDLMEKLGAMAEAIDQGKEDRRDLKDAIDKLVTGFSDLKLAFNAMTQTMASTSTIIANVASEKAGERVHQVEIRLDRYDRIFGSAGRLAWRGTIALLSTATISSVITKILTTLHVL